MPTEAHGGERMQMSYWRFAAMVATSTVVMFGLMYLNTYAADHVSWSEMRMWMALLMGASMAIVMLAFMLGMYRKRRLNIAIFAASAVLFGLSLWVMRSQATIDDVDYMRAMIPHHSIAILTSSRAQITDPRVRKLADEIIAAQRREIAEMKYLVHRIESGGEVDTLRDPGTPPGVASAEAAIRSAKLAGTDLAELDAAEVERVLGPGPRCEFSYSRAAGPVVAATAPAGGAAGQGVVKLHGRLVALGSRVDARGDPGRLVLAGEGIRVTVAPAPGSVAADGAPREAFARLVLAAGLEVGYAGFHACRGG